MLSCGEVIEVADRHPELHAAFGFDSAVLRELTECTALVVLGGIEERIRELAATAGGDVAIQFQRGPQSRSRKILQVINGL